VATSGFGENFGAGMAGGIQPTGSFDVVVSLAPGRIAFVAADAKRLYKPFAVADVPADIRDTSEVFVTAVPHAPSASGNTYSVPSTIEQIVLR